MTKKNPRRIPRTEADCQRAYDKGLDEGMKCAIELMLYILIDKHDAPREDVRQLRDEIHYTADSIREGYVTWADIRRVLREEYDLEVCMI